MKLCLRVISLLLVFLLALPVSAAVPEQITPQASDYLSSYRAYLYNPSGTTIQVCFSVVGTNILDEIGAKTVIVQQSSDGINWTNMKTFTNSAYPNMLGANRSSYGSYVTYYGISGYYYRALVRIWGGNNGIGDSRYVYTSAMLL